ncbi:UDP-glucose:2-hydroxyflavanone C-glucosyltransferase-like [Phalaenopsis equestris]|uniref:UDP-glucose:2-hydroxyflavanone C-glucosyltransferase-like n=1 Tax=Phalaenopsis equestris TaxID=78828 RepID=UPI0009E19B4C|nr:UDP-glucose:2-hydroxyflavanone C-glucosyltransferase-like [Phalaenopsis equestris]
MSTGDLKLRRVLLIPSSGMGHFIPFVRVATALSDRGISTSLLAFRPTISNAESSLLSSLPSSLVLDFPLEPLDPSLFPSADPFFRQMEVAAALNIPCFVLFISSASMLALCSVFHSLPHPTGAEINIAGGVLKIPNSSLPQPLHDPNHLFTTPTHFKENGRALAQANGIIVNTFFAMEPETLAALNSGEVITGLPPVIALGPLLPVKKQPSLASPALRWLDEQPEKSVMYVSFGSRAAMSKEQIRELGAGLEMSGCRFFWVVKSAKVDREEAVEIGELLGEGYVKRVEGRGLVVKEWVEQEVVLGHRAVAGFLSHCGWNSVMEAAAAGVRMLAWPSLGDQRVIAALVARSGLGIWPAEGAWEAEGRGFNVAEQDVYEQQLVIVAEQDV